MLVSKLPSISELAEFEAKNTTIGPEMNEALSSFISGIFDNFIERNISSIDTNLILDFFFQPKCITKNIPSKKLQESSKNLVNFKNQRI